IASGAAGACRAVHKLSGQVAVRGLPFGVQLQGVFPEFSAVAAHLVAAEGSRGVKDVVAVDPDRARAKAVRQAMRLADVACPDRGSQAIEGLIASAEDFLDILELQNVHDGSEDLFLGD